MTAPVDPSDEPLLDLDDIQAHVVPGFAHAHQRLVGMRLTGQGPPAAAEVRTVLGAILPWLTTLRRGLDLRADRREARLHDAMPPIPDDDPAAGVAISARCLAVLGDTSIAALDQAFAVGMAKRSALRDPPVSTWDVGGPGDELDVLVVLASDDPIVLRAAAAELRATVTGPALVVVHDQCGHRLAGDAEHFGFRDGVSQPTLRGLVGNDPIVPLTPRAAMPEMPDGQAYAGPGDVLVWPGQFLLGLPRQSSQSTQPNSPRPNLPVLARNGSFLVYRKLAQDVPGFRDDTARAAGRLAGPVDPDLLRAMLVGRWPDGTPLVRGTPEDAAPSRELNHFAYDNDVPAVTGTAPPVSGAVADPDGLRCPLAAHIRKVNPRDQETDKGPSARTLTFSILRRGIPYGPPWRPDGVPSSTDAEERGLLFLCYQADLAEQFELLITDWANHQDAPRAGVSNGMDLIIGRSTGRPPAAREAPISTPAAQGTVSTMLDYVRPRGGAYLFTPSLSALAALVTGRP